MFLNGFSVNCHLLELDILFLIGTHFYQRNSPYDDRRQFLWVVDVEMLGSIVNTTV